MELQSDARAYLRYVRETNPELTVTLKLHTHHPAAAAGGGGEGHGGNGEWKRAKKVEKPQLGDFVKDINFRVSGVSPRRLARLLCTSSPP